MNPIIRRDHYLQKLIDRKENGLIKVITGIRRCGKSFLLFDLFYDHLIESGVREEQIIPIALDDDMFTKYRDPDELSRFIRSKIVSKEMYYILIDEVQYAIAKDELKDPESIRLYNVLNGLMRLRNVDIYVTGSNSKMLTKDVLTVFRGRGDEVRVYPVSFREYYAAVGGDKAEAYEEYALYGGMPLVLSRKTDADKMAYLQSLFTEVYFKDITERYDITLPDVLAELTDDLCSSVGSLTNASKIANTLGTVKNISVSSTTISNYLNYLMESFLFSNAKRYDVKGKKYFEYPSKYYCAQGRARDAGGYRHRPAQRPAELPAAGGNAHHGKYHLQRAAVPGLFSRCRRGGDLGDGGKETIQKTVRDRFCCQSGRKEILYPVGPERERPVQNGDRASASEKHERFFQKDHHQQVFHEALDRRRRHFASGPV